VTSLHPIRTNHINFGTSLHSQHCEAWLLDEVLVLHMRPRLDHHASALVERAGFKGAEGPRPQASHQLNPALLVGRLNPLSTGDKFIKFAQRPVTGWTRRSHGHSCLALHLPIRRFTTYLLQPAIGSVYSRYLWENFPQLTIPHQTAAKFCPLNRGNFLLMDYKHRNYSSLSNQKSEHLCLK